jgi:hypothetical protein
MFVSRRGSLWAPVIKHGKFVLSFYSILIDLCMYRHWCEGISDTLASGKEQSSRGETFQPLYAACRVSSTVAHSVLLATLSLFTSFIYYTIEPIFKTLLVCDIFRNKGVHRDPRHIWHTCTGSLVFFSRQLLCLNTHGSIWMDTSSLE